MQVHVGFGDAVTPAPQGFELPTLLDFPAPHLGAYHPETVIAEKFEAMVHLGVANSRMKDCYDVWTMARTFAFEGPPLVAALQATFSRRRTSLPTMPTALTPEFVEDAAKRAQWSAFCGRTGLAPDTSLDSVVEVLRRFLLPVVSAIGEDRPFDETWSPNGPWRRGSREPAQ